MKKRRIISGLLVFVFCLCQCLTVFASDDEIDLDQDLEIDISDSFDVEADESFVTDSAGNVFSSGNDVAFLLDKFFSICTMGKTVTLNETEADGSVMAMAKDVTITDSNINESAFLAGESVTLRDTPVKGNVFAMGRKVDICGESNAVYAMGETVIFDGTTNALNVCGGSVSVGGKIDGDVSIDAGSIVLASDLEVTGNLKVTSEDEPEIPASVKTGSYEFEKKITDEDEADPAADIGKVTAGIIAKKIAKTIFWIIAMSLLGIFLNLFFADQLQGAAENVKKPFPAIIRGVLGWICIPVIGLFMCLTIVLAPAGGLLLLVYFILICAALCFAGASLGRIIFPKMHPFASATICIASLEIIRQLPIVGPVLAVIAQVYLISYVVGVLFENIKRNKKKQQAVPADVTETVIVNTSEVTEVTEVTKADNAAEPEETAADNSAAANIVTEEPAADNSGGEETVLDNTAVEETVADSTAFEEPAADILPETDSDEAGMTVVENKEEKTEE